jgi:hypothetical protein
MDPREHDRHVEALVHQAHQLLGRAADVADEHVRRFETDLTRDQDDLAVIEAETAQTNAMADVIRANEDLYHRIVEFVASEPGETSLQRWRIRRYLRKAVAVMDSSVHNLERSIRHRPR